MFLFLRYRNIIDWKERAVKHLTSHSELKLKLNELNSVNLFEYEMISYLPTPPLRQDMTQGQFFKRSLTGLISEFSFS